MTPQDLLADYVGRGEADPDMISIPSSPPPPSPSDRDRREDVSSFDTRRLC